MEGSLSPALYFVACPGQSCEMVMLIDGLEVKSGHLLV